MVSGGQKCSREYKLWAVFLLVIIFITPLGSNNGLYPIINNLFLVLPVSMLMTAEVFKRCRRHTAFRLVLGMVLAGVMIQSVLYGVNFVFHDAGGTAGGSAGADTS